MRVVADSHAVVWHLQGSKWLSAAAASALADAEASEGVVVSVATLIDLWYVTQTTRKVTAHDLAKLRDLLADSSSFSLHPVDVGVVDATLAIPRDTLADPWDRLIAGTALALNLPLVTRDGPIRDSGLVATLW